MAQTEGAGHRRAPHGPIIAAGLAWDAVAKKYGVQLSAQRLLSLAGMPSKAIIELLCREQGLTDVDMEASLAGLLQPPLLALLRPLMCCSGSSLRSVQSAAKRLPFLTHLQAAVAEKTVRYVELAADTKPVRCPARATPPLVLAQPRMAATCCSGLSLSSLCQVEFVLELARAAKSRGLPIAVATGGSKQQARHWAPRGAVAASCAPTRPCWPRSQPSLLSRPSRALPIGRSTSRSRQRGCWSWGPTASRCPEGSSTLS